MTGDSSRARSLEPRNLFGGISFALDPGRGFWSVVYALRLCCRCCLGVILAPLCAFQTTAHGQLGAFVAIVTVFAQQLDSATGMSTVKVDGVYRSDATPIREHNPDHPLADANGDVWSAPVDENAEMVEMLESSRQYQNVVEAMQTAKQLMLETMRMKSCSV